MKTLTPQRSPTKPGLTIIIEFTAGSRLPYVFISRTGVFAFGWLFVHVGFMTKNYRVGFDTIARELAKKHGVDAYDTFSRRTLLNALADVVEEL